VSERTEVKEAMSERVKTETTPDKKKPPGQIKKEPNTAPYRPVSMVDRYRVILILRRDQLGTNPCDPNVHDTHILDRQRKLILENDKLTKQINKYLDQIQISKEKGDGEVELLLDKLENLMGLEFTDKERKDAIAGKLDSLKETFKELKIKGVTVFFWDKEADRPAIGDHMIYGFLKASSEAIGRTRQAKAKKNKTTIPKGTVLTSISYTQGLINQHVQCEEQFIPFDKDIKKNEDGQAYYLQRSLRAMTAQGPRVTLAKSEVVPSGAKIEFTLKVMKDSPIDEEVLHNLFSYGSMKGLGQWRNAGYGQFSYELEKLS